MWVPLVGSRTKVVRETAGSHKLPIHPRLRLRGAYTGIVCDPVAVLIQKISADLRLWADVTHACSPNTVVAGGSAGHALALVGSARSGVTVLATAGIVDDAIAVVVQAVATGGRTIGLRPDLADTETPNAAGAGLGTLDALALAAAAGAA